MRPVCDAWLVTLLGTLRHASRITKKKGHVTVKSLSIKLALENEEIVPLKPFTLIRIWDEKF
jgi:hypothetical protein